MADEPKTVGPGQQIPRLRDQQFREIYSNSSLTGLSPFDITLTFQKTTEFVPGQIAQIDMIALILAPQHFKALVRSLNETLKAYEDSFGELTIADADTLPLRSAEQIKTQISAARERAAAATNPPSSTEPPPPSKRSRGAAQKKET